MAEASWGKKDLNLAFKPWIGTYGRKAFPAGGGAELGDGKVQSQRALEYLEGRWSGREEKPPA